MPYEMTKATTTTSTMTGASVPLLQGEEEELSSSSSSSYYNSRRLQLYTPAEIEHCESSKTIAKCISAKMVQSKNIGISYKTKLQSFAQFVYRRYSKMPPKE
jgi:hypothetical protein